MVDSNKILKHLKVSISLYLCMLILNSNLTAQIQDSDAVSVNEPDPPQDTHEIALKRPERVTVIASKYLRPRSDYHVLVNLANSQVPASIDLQLTGGRDSNREQTEARSILANSDETQTVKFNIGDWPPAEYILSVTAQAIDRSWNFTQEAFLSYQAKSFSGFIQTDKAIYKPGQVVQFRLIFLTSTLNPLELKGEINVTVSDPKRNIIKQWTDQSSSRGMLSLDLPLSEDPMLGDWTIRAEARQQSIVKQFTVAEYILPTFDVNIELPSYATYKDSDIVATVKASYTYGKPVSGHVTLTVQPLIRSAGIYPGLQHDATIHKARLVNGSADISLDVVKNLEQDDYEREIEFFALVEDDLTGRKYNKTEVMKVHDKNVKIEVINERETFKPGLSHLLQLKVAYQDDTPVEDSGPELELRYGFGSQNMESVKLRPVGGVAEHLIEIPKKINSTLVEDWSMTPTLLELQAIYRNQVHNLASIIPYTSKSEEYMQISLPQLQNRNKRRKSPFSTVSAVQPQSAVNVNDELKVKVRATESMQQVTCYGLARGDIVWALSLDAKNRTEFEFEIRVDQRMAPETKVLCFYIRPANKEVIVDAVVVPVGGLIRNIVKVSASRDEAKPGQEVEVGVFTKPNSLVGLLAIDQSVLLLKSGNDISQQNVADEMKSYGSSDEADGLGRTAVKNADGLFYQAGVIILTNNLVHSGFGWREGRLLYAGGIIGRKQILANERSNIALDSLILDHEFAAAPFHINRVKSEPLVIRSFFPETWLWENSTAGLDGVARFKSKIPDAITSWVLSAFSINENFGFGLSNTKSSIRVFRPFFIKLNLPYSIIRGETVNIQAVIFNYSKRPTTAKVTLENNNGDFEFVEAANNIEDEKKKMESSESRLVRVPAEDGVSVSFLITPRRLGHIDIRMTAQSEFAGDGVVKKLLVKPEGQTQHLNHAFLVNLPGPQSTQSKNFSIDVPPNAVPDSRKVSASVVGDIMGPGLSNVDDLLRLPYGCGEQNMINLVPNIVILNYLKNTKRFKDNQRTRAVRNIETGYQRQLNYKRSDGSFSAFGNQDTNGSVWLTAYVLKTLQQAKNVITADEKIIRRAANFIARHSRPDGRIDEVGMLHNKKLQSLSLNSAAGSNNYLTAYAMMALLQKPIVPDGDAPAPVALDEVLEKGLNYLERQLDDTAKLDSPYDLAIITYVLHLANRQEPMDKAYEQLWLRAQEDNDLIWWAYKEPQVTDLGSRGDSSSKFQANSESDESSERDFAATFGKAASTTTAQPPLKPIPVNPKHSAHLFIPESLSIEMTAFALLTTARRGELDRALPIVKWLIAQQNSNGGFASTQDTVLAIEALAAFADASSRAISMDIEILYPRSARQKSEIRRNNIDQFLIANTNALINQQTRLPDNITWVQVKATGSGAAVVQVSWQYNLLVSAEKPAFYLNPILDKTSNINYLQLSICTYYKAGDASNMALMEVELPSGYKADEEALPGLTRSKDIKRIDTDNDGTKVLIYFDKVTRDEICLTVPAHRTSKVSNNKPVPVTIYDYYNRQQAARIFYEPQPASSCDICDIDNCGESCSTKPKKLDRLISLHEQRKLSTLQATSPPASTFGGNQTVLNAGSGPYFNATEALPLAPVLMTLLSITRGIYDQLY